MSIFGSLFGGDSASGGLQEGFSVARKQINRKLGEGLGLLNAGNKAARGNLDNAMDQYDPLVQNANQGANRYASALGLNGAHAGQKAVNKFQNSPGYEFQMNAGLDALDRRAAASGSLGSGNAQIDALGFSQGLADQSWGSYLDRLSGQQTMAAQIAQQRAGLLGQKAQLNANTGGAGLNATVGVGSTLFGGQMQNRSNMASADMANEASGFGALGGLLGGASMLTGGFTKMPFAGLMGSK